MPFLMRRLRRVLLLSVALPLAGRLVKAIGERRDSDRLRGVGETMQRRRRR